MCLLVIPSPVQPDVYPAPEGCPSAGCGSRHGQFRQAMRKSLRDPYLHEVIAHRYQCPRCGRTFRLYPVGVSRDQTSARLKGLAVLFSVLGMSYGEVAIALAALGWPLSKVAVINAVQAAGARVAGLRREAAQREGGRVGAGGRSDLGALCRPVADGRRQRRCRDGAGAEGGPVARRRSGHADRLDRELGGGDRGRGIGLRRRRWLQDGG